MTTPATGTSRDREAALALIAEIGVGMLTSRGNDRLDARPMRIHLDPGAGILFFTHRHDARGYAHVRDPAGLLTITDPAQGRYLSLSGTVSILADRTSARAHWDSEAAEWFPGGPDDPDLMLVRFQPERGELWEGPVHPGTGHHVTFALNVADCVANARAHIEERLDEELDESFPASDPPSTIQPHRAFT
ncbi:pyridoxamine 5'-phosphate oxidase family protein [Segnochrobactraceae bacterium EtOH-i3]